jgi:uncharacterized protein (DUF1778 family)
VEQTVGPNRLPDKEHRDDVQPIGAEEQNVSRNRPERPPKQRGGSTVKSSNDNNKKWSGRLPFRTDPSTHRKIALAAQQAGQPINTWMEEIVSQAANETLGHISADTKIASGKIRDLIENPEAAIQLVKTLAKFLEDDDPYALLRFDSALRKLLIGLDAILPFLKKDGEPIVWTKISPIAEDAEAVYRMVTTTVPLLRGNDPNHTLQLSQALKKFILGLDAIKPFLKGEATATSLKIVKEITDQL